MRYNKGMTLIELLILVFVAGFIVIGVGLYGGILAGNYWYTDDGIMKKIKLQDPAAIEVYDSNRGIWGYSEILVRYPDGPDGKPVYKTWLADTCITFAAEVKPKPEK